MVDAFETNLSKSSDGDFIFTMGTFAGGIEKHPAFSQQVPDWVPTSARFRKYIAMLSEIVAGKTSLTPEQEAERLAIREKAQQDLTYAGQFLVMYAAHHNDPSSLQNLGVELKQRVYTKTPVSLPGKPTKFQVRNGKQSGTVSVMINRGQGKGSIELAVNEVDPANETAWRPMDDHYYESRFDVNGFVRVREYFFRARFHNSAGPGPWSDIASLVIV